MRRSRPRSLPAMVAAVALAVLAGVAGFAFGAQGHRVVTTRVGFAYASPVQAFVQSRGVVYDIPSDVPWVDSGGVMHEGGLWPTCLPIYRRTRIAFGTVDVTLPNGASTSATVWVHC